MMEKLELLTKHIEKHDLSEAIGSGADADYQAAAEFALDGQCLARYSVRDLR